MPKTSNKEPKGFKKEHYNVPQMLFYAVMARINILIWGRATGKTTGPGALFSYDNIMKMPRSIGGFVNISYEKLLTVLIPGVVAGWQKLGYEKDVHYFVRRFPPEKFRWPKSIRQPLKPEHYISWYNGSGIQLISLDRPGTYNGANIDWLYGDEARFLDREKLNQVMLTVRGNAEHFGHLSNHGSVLFTTDMPRGSKEKWLLDYKELMDTETVELIISIQQRIIELERSYLGCSSPRSQYNIRRKIEKFQEYINEMRKELVYFSTATTFDNVHALGLDPIKNFKRLLSDLEFQISVLNKEINQIEDGFYGSFLIDHHGYTASNYEHIDQLELTYTKADTQDCLWDEDLQMHEPLDIAADYNAAINWVVIGQEYNDQYRVLNSMFVKHPERIKDLVAKFVRYYEPKPLKEVNYYYDHTAIAENAKDDVSFSDEWCNELEKAGWTVYRHYMGQAPTYKARYELFQKMFREDEPLLPRLRMNRARNEDLILSLESAPFVQGKTGFEKDKRSEKDPNCPPEHATHGSEAFDQLIYATQRHKVAGGSTFVDLS